MLSVSPDRTNKCVFISTIFPNVFSCVQAMVHIPHTGPQLPINRRSMTTTGRPCATQQVGAIWFATMQGICCLLYVVCSGILTRRSFGVWMRFSLTKYAISDSNHCGKTSNCFYVQTFWLQTTIYRRMRFVSLKNHSRRIRKATNLTMSHHAPQQCCCCCCCYCYAYYYICYHCEDWPSQHKFLYNFGDHKQINKWRH